MTVTANLGRVKPIYRGPYNGATAYVPLDFVVQGSVTYYCIANTTGNAPPNATFWEPMVDITGYATTQFVSDQLFKRENRIINGAFDIWQRGAYRNASGFAADRWFNSLAGGTQAIYQGHFSPGEKLGRNNPRNFLRHEVNGLTNPDQLAATSINIEDVRSYAGETITILGWARKASGAGNNMVAEMTQIFGSGGSPSAILAGIGSSTVSLTASWEPFAAVIAVPSMTGKVIGTNGDDRLSLNFWFSAGSDYNARTNSLGFQNIVVDLWGIHIRRGIYPASAALEYIAPSEVDEFPRCQRYYQIIGQVVNPTNNWQTVRLVSRMRRAPTISFSFDAGTGAIFTPSFAGGEVARAMLVQESAHSQVATATILADAEF